MIPDSEISKCPEHEVKSKMGTIYVNEKILEEYSEIDLYFYKNYKKKQKLTTMITNTYYLELMFFLLNIFQRKKLMKKVILTETLFLKKKDKKRQKKNLVVNLLELIRGEKVMMQTMKLVEYRRLSASLKIKKKKTK